MENGNMENNSVAIIGRTNVGKSTLLNRLTDSKKAIVSPIPGTTRDRNYGQCFWRGQEFTLIDTGGLENIKKTRKQKNKKTTDITDIEEAVARQTFNEIDNANLIILLLDLKAGIMPQEKEVLKLLRQKKKKVILVVNKCDSKTIKQGVGLEYLKLGLGEPVLISATSGVGTGNLLDEVIKNLPLKSPTVNIQHPTSNILIIGKPNVGKSSLLNAIAGEEKVIVSEIPHTTREAQDTLLTYQGQNIRLIDTAGIRRRAKIDNLIEKLGVKQSLENIKKSDIILFMIAASEKLSRQDQSLARLIRESNKPTIILANKWDLVKGVEMSEYEKYFRKYFPHLSFAPLIFISCKTKKNTDKILDTALEILKESNLEITANALNKFLTRIMGNLRKFQGKSKTVPRLLDLKQTKTNPPAFEIIMKDSRLKKPHPSTIKYVENQLRQKFNLHNIPLKITLRTIKIKP